MPPQYIPHMQSGIFLLATFDIGERLVALETVMVQTGLLQAEDTVIAHACHGHTLQLWRERDVALW